MRSKLRTGEKVVLEVEKHWVVLAKPAVILALSILFMLYCLMTDAVFFKQFRGVGAAAVVICGIFLWYSIQARKVNLWIVTTDRIIDEEGLFTWVAKDSPIDKINNITDTQTVLGRLLDFGNIEIQTAASEGATISTFVSHPKKLSDSVVQLQSGIRSGSVIGIEGATKGDTRICPYCAETIKKQASICRYCNRAVTPDAAESLSASHQESSHEGPSGTIAGGMR